MFSALLSFLGGSVFRMIWGEVSAFVNKRQDHAYELERMRTQSELEDKAAERQARQIELSHQLGVKTIEVQRDADVMKAEAEAFASALKDAQRPTGITWVDAWNAAVRPSYATFALLLWILKVATQDFTMDDFDIGLLAVIAGFYFASRELSKRGK